MKTTAHGQDFEIEVPHWENPEDASRVTGIVESWLQGLSAEQAAKLHADLSAFEESSADNDQEMTVPVLEAFQACEAATKAIFDEWGFVPDSGHECTLRAR